MSARILALLLLALLALSRRPGPLPPNFSPVYALAFCSGVYLPGRLGDRETEENEEAPQTGPEAEPSQA